ncbi:hypothetical protein CSKR_106294, partial [Clonorchis sinensis]
MTVIANKENTDGTNEYNERGEIPKHWFDEHGNPSDQPVRCNLWQYEILPLQLHSTTSSSYTPTFGSPFANQRISRGKVNGAYDEPNSNHPSWNFMSLMLVTSIVGVTKQRDISASLEQVGNLRKNEDSYNAGNQRKTRVFRCHPLQAQPGCWHFGSKRNILIRNTTVLSADNCFADFLQFLVALFQNFKPCKTSEKT